jgi:hypothetical protein
MAEHTAAVLVGHPHRRRSDADLGQVPDDRREAVERHEVQRGHSGGQAREAAAARHADRGGQPDRRRRREAVHRVPAHDDQPGTEEADARDDLGRDPGRVQDAQLPHEDVLETVLADQHDQRGGDADDGVRTQARGLLPELALQADESGQQEGQT